VTEPPPEGERKTYAFGGGHVHIFSVACKRHNLFSLSGPVV
jgi:hypothetical protein